MKVIYCLMILLCPCIKVFSQPATPQKLRIGDTVPDIVFNNTVNYKTVKSNLYSFQNKLILVDLWSSSCGACLHYFPMLDSMVKVYPDQLSVLLINSVKSETKEKALKVAGRVKITNGNSFQLPMMLGDTTLNQLFPHDYIPKYIWLDAQFKVLAVTDAEEVSAERLQAYIKGAPVTFLESEDMSSFKKDMPLFMNGNGGSGKQLLARSMITAFIPGLPQASYIKKDSLGMVQQLMLTNQPILALLRRAYGYNDPGERIEWTKEVKNLLDMEGREGSWFIANSYTYELVTPPVSYEQAMQYMQEDLRRYFKYSATIKKMPTPCYVLTTDSSQVSHFKTKGGHPLNRLTDTTKRIIQNRPVFDVAEFLEHHLSLPVINASTYTGKTDLDLTGISLINIPELQHTLSRFGIYISKTEMPLDHFFIHHLPN